MSNKPKYSTKSSPKGKFNIETGEFDPPVRFFNIPLGQFTRNYTQTTKRGLLTTNKG